jgi:hypothetical protein
MDFKVTIEWDYQIGMPYEKVLDFLDTIQNDFTNKDYGSSVSRIFVVMSALFRDLKQRKRFKKDIGRFDYDIILDYFLVKNSPIEEKKKIIRQQMIDITEETFSKYKFDDFDKSAFLADFKSIVNSVEW